MEIWKKVVGFEGLYEVSNKGRVRSVATTVKCKDGRTLPRKSKLKSITTGSHGRLQVMLHKNNTQKNCYVSHLVAEAFLGPRPTGLDVLHGPNGLKDNSVENLSYGTKSKNMGEDRVRDGTHNRGERCGNCKLKEEQVLRYKRNEEGWSTYRWSKEFGVAYETLRCIKIGKSWSWLEP